MEPCSGFDDRIILDYGCGLGHDVIGLSEYSKPAKIIEIDVSKTSLKETEKCVNLYNALSFVDIVQIEKGRSIPLPDNSVDYIHSSGVLNHTPNLE